MERFENKSKQCGGSRPHLSYAQAARAGHRSEQAKINDAAKWVAAVRRVIANIPTNPSSSSTPGTPTASGEYFRKSSPSLAYFHSTTAIAPFSNMVPAPNKVSVALGNKSPLLPIPDDNVSGPQTKMIRISELPFEIQDIIFELGTSMLIYAFNMLVDCLHPVFYYGYRPMRTFGLPLGQHIASDEHLIREIVGSCPLTYTCRRSRAAVFRRLHKLVQGTKNHEAKVSTTILEYIHITVRLRDVAHTQRKSIDSRNVPTVYSGMIVVMPSLRLYDKPLMLVAALESQHLVLCHHVYHYVDRVDAEWWWNRDVGEARMSPSLEDFLGNFPLATHLTVTPRLPFMLSAQGVTPGMTDGNHHLREFRAKKEELAILKLREKERYKTLDRKVTSLCVQEGWTWRTTYVTRDFPLPIFEATREVKPRRLPGSAYKLEDLDGNEL
ncbi:hypothetical protein CKAH01_17354 [Colletotrichum kahawae]|uniref:Uncharacterized protein n=1 Tax=Colletotrichum kahawae TaxID=34407 RepID=A0AAD9YBV7_COLKA|nr:hypothetical protein CKAH01_17354 [Colletotrichum kahawae]